MIKIILFVIIIIPQISFSAENIEKDLKEITNKLRCMTCQHQTIYDSDAEFSQDIKKIVQKRSREKYRIKGCKKGRVKNVCKNCL